MYIAAFSIPWDENVRVGSHAMRVVSATLMCVCVEMYVALVRLIQDNSSKTFKTTPQNIQDNSSKTFSTNTKAPFFRSK